MLDKESLAYCVGGIALILVAVFFLFLFKKAVTRTLPLNQIIGLRTRNTMFSGDVWSSVHRRYAWIFLISSIGFIVSGLALIAICAFPTSFWYLIKMFYGSLGIIFILIVAGGIKADKYARSIIELSENR
ncbi:SdpI family protein [Schaalia vaccimaxillae]|uniref:SdpI family protein n=1 Tax=Schaalia vaccimaxillae TaxID=183916 RepID=UPI000A028C48|nr:SdpI family protein [Schaalia vaccimaxillae]